MSWAEDTKFRFQIFSVMMALAGPVLLIWQAKDTLREIASSNWPTVEGEVQELVAKRSVTDNGKTLQFYGRVKYTYIVDGVEYSTDLTDFGPGTKWPDRSSALVDISQYRVGLKVPVYYDPAEPSVGVLQPGLPQPHRLAMILLIVFTIVCSICAGFTIRSWI